MDNNKSYASFDKNKLFPEIVAMDKLEPISKSVEKPPPIVEQKKTSQIFIEKKKEVKFNPEEMTVSESDITKPRDYSHLVEARKKGALTRQKKAELKRLKKEEIKKQKSIEKAQRREATAERNRQKARARYHREKEKKKQQEVKGIEEKIKIMSKPIPILTNKDIAKGVHKKNAQKALEFETFAKYMMRYEDMKSSYQKQEDAKKLRKEAKQRAEEEAKPKPYYPEGMPDILNMYDPTNRYTEFNGI